MTLHRVFLIAAATTLLLSACAPIQPRTTLAIGREASPNFGERRANLVIIHHTSDATMRESMRTLTSPALKVSAHYLIGRDGTIVQLVEENARAWHAGQSWWGGFTDINSVSLGIELDNNGFEPFADTQIDSLLSLLVDIRQRYQIPTANFIGHADVSPTRKDDPSVFFPWKKLADQGFGLWCDAPLVPAPIGFDIELALMAIGYDPSTPDASRQAFRLHFMHGNSAPSAEDEKAMAFCLLQMKRSMRL